MSELVTLSPESVEAVAEALAAKLAPNTRPELSTAEAMQLTGHRSESAFYRWATSRGVAHRARSLPSHRATPRTRPMTPHRNLPRAYFADAPTPPPAGQPTASSHISPPDMTGASPELDKVPAPADDTAAVRQGGQFHARSATSRRAYHFRQA